MREIPCFTAVISFACILALAGCAGMPHTMSDNDDSLPSPDGAVSAGPPPSAPVPSPGAPAAVAGANPVVNAAPPVENAGTPPSGNGSLAMPDMNSGFDNLELVDASLKSKLVVLRVGSNRTDANLLSVFAGLKNKTRHRLSLEVQTLYKDKSGNPMNSQAGWIPLTLKPHEETQYRSVAISEDADDFIIRIRRASIATAGKN